MEFSKTQYLPCLLSTHGYVKTGTRDKVAPRPPGIVLFRALIVASVILIRVNGIYGVFEAGQSRLLQVNATDTSVDPCVTVPDTSLCSKGKLDYAFLMIGQYPGIDCLTYEAIQDVSHLGSWAFVDLETNCANMDLRYQGREHPPLTYEEIVDAVTCVSQDRAPVFLTDWAEVKGLTKKLMLSDCKAASTIVERNAFQCRESSEAVCKGGALDLTVLDTQARPDCPAFEVRADVVTRGPTAALKDWNEYCASGGSSTQYSNNCPGNQVNRRTFHTYSSRSSTEMSHHWHYHNIRGLLYDPFVISSGNALGCRDDTCTADGSLSCWPGPRMRTGANLFNGQTRVYTCDGVPGKAHVVGRFSGTYEMQGTAYSTGAANECTVSQPSFQRVRITCSASAWSDVWIHQLGDWDNITTESPNLRNVCEQVQVAT